MQYYLLLRHLAQNYRLMSNPAQHANFPKGEFTQYPFFVRFRPFFLRFCFSLTKNALFHQHFYVPISALTRQSHTEQKFSEKIFL